MVASLQPCPYRSKAVRALDKINAVIPCVELSMGRRHRPEAHTHDGSHTAFRLLGARTAPIDAPSTERRRS